jgi:hypothetical protein
VCIPRPHSVMVRRLPNPLLSFFRFEVRGYEAVGRSRTPNNTINNNSGSSAQRSLCLRGLLYYFGGVCVDSAFCACNLQHGAANIDHRQCDCSRRLIVFHSLLYERPSNNLPPQVSTSVSECKFMFHSLETSLIKLNFDASPSAELTYIERHGRARISCAPFPCA